MSLNDQGCIYTRPHLKDICQGPVIGCCLNPFTLVVEETLLLIYEDHWPDWDFVLCLWKWQLWKSKMAVIIINLAKIIFIAIYLMKSSCYVKSGWIKMFCLKVRYFEQNWKISEKIQGGRRLGVYKAVVGKGLMFIDYLKFEWVSQFQEWMCSPCAINVWIKIRSLITTACFEVKIRTCHNYWCKWWQWWVSEHDLLWALALLFRSGCWFFSKLMNAWKWL